MRLSILLVSPNGPHTTESIDCLSHCIKHSWLGGVSSSSSLPSFFLGQFGVTLRLFAQRPILIVLPLVSVIPAVIIAWYIRQQDRKKEPLGTLAVTFVLGGLLANFAAVFNEAARTFTGAVPVLGTFFLVYFVVGPGEELAKWAAARLHAYDRPEFDVIVDGAMYGAVAGLGFASIENVIYILDGSLPAVQAGQTGGALLSAAALTTGARAFAGPGHVIWSGIAGYYLGMAKFNPGSYGPLAVKGLLIAAVLHGTYDFVAFVMSDYPSFFGVFSLTLFPGIVIFHIVTLTYLVRKIRRHQQTTKEGTISGLDQTI